MENLFVPEHLEKALRDKGCQLIAVEIIGFKGLLWQQVIDWIREEKGIIIEVTPFWGTDRYMHGYSYVGYHKKTGEYACVMHGFVETYYHSLKSGLEKVIESIEATIT